MTLHHKIRFVPQVKFDGGNDGQPVYAISVAKKSNGDQVIRYVHTGNNDVKTILWEVLVAPYLGHWIHVYEKIKFGTSGTLEVCLCVCLFTSLQYSTTMCKNTIQK